MYTLYWDVTPKYSAKIRLPLIANEEINKQLLPFCIWGLQHQFNCLLMKKVPLIGQKLLSSGKTEGSTDQNHYIFLENNLNSVSLKTGIKNPLSSAEAQRVLFWVGRIRRLSNVRYRVTRTEPLRRKTNVAQSLNKRIKIMLVFQWYFTLVKSVFKINWVQHSDEALKYGGSEWLNPSLAKIPRILYENSWPRPGAIIRDGDRKRASLLVLGLSPWYGTIFLLLEQIAPSPAAHACICCEDFSGCRAG